MKLNSVIVTKITELSHIISYTTIFPIRSKVDNCVLMKELSSIWQVIY